MSTHNISFCNEIRKKNQHCLVSKKNYLELCVLTHEVLQNNPFKPSELFYPSFLDRSIYSRRGVWVICIIIFKRNSCI